MVPEVNVRWRCSLCNQCVRASLVSRAGSSCESRWRSAFLSSLRQTRVRTLKSPAWWETEAVNNLLKFILNQNDQIVLSHVQCEQNILFSVCFHSERAINILCLVLSQRCWLDVLHRTRFSIVVPDSSGGVNWGPPTCWILSWHKAQTRSCTAAPWILYHLLERGSSLPGIYEQSAKTTRIFFYLQPLRQHVEGIISRALHIGPHWNVPTNMCLLDIKDINIPQKMTT